MKLHFKICLGIIALNLTVVHPVAAQSVVIKHILIPGNQAEKDDSDGEENPVQQEDQEMNDANEEEQEDDEFYDPADENHEVIYSLTDEQEEALGYDSKFYSSINFDHETFNLPNVTKKRTVYLAIDNLRGESILNCQIGCYHDDNLISTIRGSIVSFILFGVASLRWDWREGYLNQNWGLSPSKRGPKLVRMPDLLDVHNDPDQYLDGKGFKTELFSPKGNFSSDRKKLLVDVLEQELRRKISECEAMLSLYNFMDFGHPNNEGLEDKPSVEQIQLFASNYKPARKLQFYTTALEDLEAMEPKLNENTLVGFDPKTYTILLLNKLPKKAIEIFAIKLSRALYNDLGNENPSSDMPDVEDIFDQLCSDEHSEEVDTMEDDEQ
jgi:hypothetical protein